jgi:hypothetical protein
MTKSNSNVILSAILLWSTPLLAHPGGHGHADSNNARASRTWTFAAEGSHLHGTFVAAKDGKVQIRRDGGVLTTAFMARSYSATVKSIHSHGRNHCDLPYLPCATPRSPSSPKSSRTAFV